MGRPKVLLLGDSLTQTAFEGWAAALADIYQRRADVLNRGMSGYNTRWYLKYAHDHGIWNEDEVMLITLFFGANDASLAAENPHAHVPLGEYSANLSQLIKSCRISYPKAKIICITPPPVHHGQRLAYQKERFGSEKATGVLERTLENTGNYAKACVIVSEQYRVPHLDLYHAMLVPPKTTTTATATTLENGGTEKEHAGDSHSKDEQKEVADHGRYFTDGLHFSKEGHDFVAQAILQLIEKELPELHVGKDPVTGQWNNSETTCTSIVSSGPYHDQIDHTCFEKAFQKGGEIVQPVEDSTTIADEDTAQEDGVENNNDDDDEDDEEDQGEADDFEEEEDGIDDMAAAAAIVAAETADDDDDDDNDVKADAEDQDQDKEEKTNDHDNDDEDLQPEFNGNDKTDNDFVDKEGASDTVDASDDEPDPKRPRTDESTE
jgi:isoamyl acetate esterase